MLSGVNIPEQLTLAFHKQGCIQRLVGASAARVPCITSQDFKAQLLIFAAATDTAAAAAAAAAAATAVASCN